MTTTTIQQLKEMNKRELAIWASTVKADDLKSILRAENLAGGISKFKKADLLNVVLDLVEGIETELTKQLKSNPKTKTKKETTTSKKKATDKKAQTQEEACYEKIKNKGYEFFEIRYKAKTLEEFKDKYSKIKTIYRKLAKFYHPDNLETGNEEKFKEIQKAWEVAEKFNKQRKEKLQRKTA